MSAYFWFNLLTAWFICIMTWNTGISTSDDNMSSSCHYDLDVAWTSEISNSLVAASPLVADINADNRLDVISPAFTEEVAVLQGVNGQNLRGTSWPVIVQGRSFHASPLLYDINGDGREDIVLFTAEGDILFVDADGDLMDEPKMRVPPLDIKREWWSETTGVRPDAIGQFVRTSAPGRTASHETGTSQFVSVDAHVLATPVIADLNQDGVTEELIVPVSYYYDAETYSSAERFAELGILESDLQGYLAGGVVLFNLSTGQIYKEVILEMSMVSDEFPAYVLFTPTIVDLDSEGGPLEMVLGTSAGNVHVLDHTGAPRDGFPLLLSTLHGQITIEDINADGRLEMVVMDTSSNVMCLDAAGKELWDTQISGSSSAGSRVADINQDGHLDVVIATNDGHVWALRGDTGKPLEGWPLDLGGRFLASPLITRLRPSPAPLHVIVADYEGSLYIISGDDACLEVIRLEEHVMTPVLAADLIPTTSDLELLIATSDGTLMCLRTNGTSEKGEWEEIEAWHADTPTYNKFTYWDNKVGVRFSADTKQLEYVAGRSFVVKFEIVDNRPTPGEQRTYQVQITCGRIVLLPRRTLAETGSHRLRIATPNQPIRAVVTVHVTNAHGQLFRDSFAVSFNTKFITEVQWLLFVPFVAMVTLLLLVHGFPEVDLLPMTQGVKHR